MIDTKPPTDNEELVAGINSLLVDAGLSRQTALDITTASDAKQEQLGHHPNKAAYVAGGIYFTHGLGADHIFGVAGFHALDWREALARIESGRDNDDAGELLARLRLACEADPMLEATGHALFAEFGLLKEGSLDAFWIKRPKLGLGQAAKAFGLEPAHAEGHRGLYALDLAVLRRGCERVSGGQADQRFGALLRPLIEMGGERLARIGAAAFHADAEARYHEDCRRFEEYQRTNLSRRWRWKPPLSRQGHLAVTTARTLNIALPAERTRGHAATWLDEHNANLRFIKEDRT